MKLTFEPLGRFIHEVDVRNTDLSVTNLMGVNLSKQLMPSVANIVGTDLSAYKVVKKRQFACKLMSVGRDACLPIALKTDENPIIISSAYYAFEVNDESELIPEYLLMCFLRPDFDRELWFKTGGDVRGGVTWEEFCNIRIPYCNLEEQKKIVNVYLTVKQRVEILKKENDVLFDCLIEIYKKHTENASSLTAVTLDDICNFQEGYVNPDIDPLNPETLKDEHKIPQRIIDALTREFDQLDKGYRKNLYDRNQQRREIGHNKKNATDDNQRISQHHGNKISWQTVHSDHMEIIRNNGHRTDPS